MEAIPRAVWASNYLVDVLYRPDSSSLDAHRRVDAAAHVDPHPDSDTDRDAEADRHAHRDHPAARGPHAQRAPGSKGSGQKNCINVPSACGYPMRRTRV